MPDSMPILDPAGVPADDTPLCEGCGYVLAGLPRSGHCPECGKPAAESLDAPRSPTPFEARPTAATLARTAAAALLRPGRFFRTLTVRPDAAHDHRANLFGLLAVAAAAVGFATIGELHVRTLGLANAGAPLDFLGGPVPAWFAFFVAAAAAMLLGREVAARLTAYEARTRGLRLPVGRVRRCLAYQGVGLVAVAGVVCVYVIVANALLARGLVGPGAVTYYIYGLAALVPVAGVYLFLTYWAAMRGVMYASR